MKSCAQWKTALTRMEPKQNLIKPKKLECPQSYVSKYESGERRLDILEVQDICIACDTTLVNFSKRLEST